MNRYLVILLLITIFYPFNIAHPSDPVNCTNGCFILNAHSIATLPSGSYNVGFAYNCGIATFGSSNSSGWRQSIQFHIWQFNGSSWVNIKSNQVYLYGSVADDFYQQYHQGDSSWTPNSSFPNGCNLGCSADTGKISYNLKEYDNPDQPPVTGNVCYDDCQQSSEILWSDCLAGSCVASVKYTQTGQSCGTETSVDNLQENEPQRCQDEINEKIAQCGGSLKVLSFDFESCTGECTPDSCGDKWNELVNRCGGIMAVSTWNNETCTGSCVNDPVPDIEEPDSEAVPDDINTEVKTNPDGSKIVTQTTTYYVDNTTYTETTTTTYDPSGNKTGESTSTSSSPTTPSGSGGSAPSSWYTKTCDLTKGFESCVNFQQIRNATAAFNNTFIVQFPNLILDCLGYVEGDGCVYPPVLTIDFHNAFTSDDIKIDLSPFESVAYVMKFFFSLLCLLLTGKAVMYLFQ